MVKDVRQDIYDTIYKVCSKYIDVYDVLPPADTPYPFIRVGEYTGNDEANKTHVFGTYNQMIHLFWLASDRSGLTDMMGNLKRDLRNLTKTTGGYGFLLTLSERVLSEVAENKALLHGVLILDAKFN